MLGPVSRDGAFRQGFSPPRLEAAETHHIGAQLQPPSLGGDDAAEKHPIVALAATQHGVVTTAQLLDAGVGRRSIARRVARGWLVPLHRGVFQVGPTASEYGAEMAAVLAIGGDAVLSHQSAAALWGIARRDHEVHVTTTRRGRRSRSGVRVHQSASLNAVVHNGLPLTTPARTLNDLKRTATPDEVDRAREQAAVFGLVLEDDDPYPEFTRSEGERRLKALCKAAGLPAPRMNARVAGWEVDAYWPAHNLIVEIDGWRYHRTRKRFEDDRRKDAALQAAGYRVVRITYSRLRDEPYSLSAQLGALLAAATG
jgi:very-short-patch-repair endonuclease